MALAVYRPEDRPVRLCADCRRPLGRDEAARREQEPVHEGPYCGPGGGR